VVFALSSLEQGRLRSSLLVPLGVRKLDLFAGDLGDAIDLEVARWAGWYDYDRPQDFLGGETLAEFYQH